MKCNTNIFSKIYYQLIIWFNKEPQIKLEIRSGFLKLALTKGGNE